MAGSFKISGLPIRARLHFSDSWEVTAARKAGVIHLTISRVQRGNEFEVNAWAIRDRFLAISTWQEAKKFLRKYGPFLRADASAWASPTETCSTTMLELARYQDAFRHFISEPSPDWSEGNSLDSTAFMLNMYRSPSFKLDMGHAVVSGTKEPSPYLSIDMHDVRDAIYGTIYLDKMRGLRGGVCKREGCTNTFLTTDPRKQYCESVGDCGALDRIRKLRARQRAMKSGGSNGEA